MEDKIDELATKTDKTLLQETVKNMARRYQEPSKKYMVSGSREQFSLEKRERGLSLRVDRNWLRMKKNLSVIYNN